MSEFRFDLPNCEHKVIIKAENYEKAKERFGNIYNPKDDN